MDRHWVIIRYSRTPEGTCDDDDDDDDGVLCVAFLDTTSRAIRIAYEDDGLVESWKASLRRKKTGRAALYFLSSLSSSQTRSSRANPLICTLI